MSFPNHDKWKILDHIQAAIRHKKNGHLKKPKNPDSENLSYEFPVSQEHVGNNIPKTNFQVESNYEDSPSRVIIYRHHPWKNRGAPGKQVNLPKTINHLLTLAGRIFGFHPVKIFNEDGAEIEDINVIRDNDQLYFADKEELEEAIRPKKSF